jgi:hypothetical protein
VADGKVAGAGVELGTVACGDEASGDETFCGGTNGGSWTEAPFEIEDWASAGSGRNISTEGGVETVGSVEVASAATGAVLSGVPVPNVGFACASAPADSVTST